MAKGRTLPLITAGFVVALFGAAQAESPYDMTYSVDRDTSVHTAISASSPVKATLPAGSSGIVLRWCRPEIPFEKWEFGGTPARRRILDERRCEIEQGGRVGFVDGRRLDPE